MNTHLLQIGLICFSCLLLFSCAKEPGIGGRGVIKGKLFIRDFVDGDLEAEYYAPEERVYIIYGDDEVYNDMMRTHFDGSYRFEYLRTGTYTIFAYSDCASCPSGTEARMISTEITSPNEVIELDDLVLIQLSQ